MKRITTLITIIIVLCTAPITTFAAGDKLAQESLPLNSSGDKTPLTIIGGYLGRSVWGQEAYGVKRSVWGQVYK